MALEAIDLTLSISKTKCRRVPHNLRLSESMLRRPGGERKNYDFFEKYPGNNDIYYRLKIIDLDGTVNYSKIVILKILPVIINSIIQNPFVNEITISIESNKGSLLNWSMP